MVFTALKLLCLFQFKEHKYVPQLPDWHDDMPPAVGSTVSVIQLGRLVFSFTAFSILLWLASVVLRGVRSKITSSAWSANLNNYTVVLHFNNTPVLILILLYTYGREHRIWIQCTLGLCSWVQTSSMHTCISQIIVLAYEPDESRTKFSV
jgi:hypothetical protein